MLLLGDIRQVFEETGRGKLASSDLIRRLISMQGRPWREFKHQKPVTTSQVAALLKPFGIVPGTKAQ